MTLTSLRDIRCIERSILRQASVRALIGAGPLRLVTAHGGGLCPEDQPNVFRRHARTFVLPVPPTCDVIAWRLSPKSCRMSAGMEATWTQVADHDRPAVKRVVIANPDRRSARGDPGGHGRRSRDCGAGTKSCARREIILKEGFIDVRPRPRGKSRVHGLPKKHGLGGHISTWHRNPTGCPAGWVPIRRYVAIVDDFQQSPSQRVMNTTIGIAWLP